MPKAMRCRALYPGTFDPFTNGHLDIAQRAAAIFDELVIGVASDSGKDTLFPLEERVEMVRDACRHLPTVRVESFQGLVVAFASSIGARVLVKGLRAVTDFEREMQMAMMNRSLAPDLDTVFLVADTMYTFLSSGLVKEVCMLGGDVSAYVPETVLPRIVARLQPGRDQR
jgi:pantetheine-phosphate adenylyltransferase